MTISVYRTAIAALVLFAASVWAGALPQVRGLLRERPVPSVAVGTSMAAYQGLYFFSVTSPGHTSTGPHPVAGVLAAIGAGASFAVTAAAGRTLARSRRPLVVTTAGMAIGTCVLVPIAVLGGLAGHGPAGSADPRVLGLLVYLGVATMALAYALLYAGLRTVSGSSAVIVALLEPVAAAVAAALFLGERIGPVALLGTIMILAAVAGLERDVPASPAMPDPAGGAVAESSTAGRG